MTDSISIRAFIDGEKERHKQRYEKQTASEVLSDPMPVLILNWPHRFKQQGYHPVTLGRSNSVIEVNEWCNKTFGREHYAITAGHYWFETEQAANWFALRWS